MVLCKKEMNLKASVGIKFYFGGFFNGQQGKLGKMTTAFYSGFLFSNVTNLGD